MAEIRTVGVIGCGLMGHGITQVSAEAGYRVLVREVDDATLARGIGTIEKQLARAVEKGKSSDEAAAAVRGRIEGTTDYGALADCDLVLEAIIGRSLISISLLMPRRPRTNSGPLFHLQSRTLRRLCAKLISFGCKRTWTANFANV